MLLLCKKNRRPKSYHWGSRSEVRRVEQRWKAAIDTTCYRNTQIRKK